MLVRSSFGKKVSAPFPLGQIYVMVSALSKMKISCTSQVSNAKDGKLLLLSVVSRYSMITSMLD